MCRLRLACSRSLLHPPPSSGRLYHTAEFLSLAGTPLLIVGWHPTATRRVAPYCSSSLASIRSARWLLSPSPLRLSHLFSVTPTRRLALSPWLLSNALDRCNDQHGRASGCTEPAVSVFSAVSSNLPTPLRPAFPVFEKVVYFVSGRLLKGLGLSTCTFLCIVSLHVWGILS